MYRPPMRSQPQPPERLMLFIEGITSAATTTAPIAGTDSNPTAIRTYT
jgi:hypothetical protein